jgi:N-acetylglucosamine-6-phosphate deacetylase
LFAVFPKCPRHNLSRAFVCPVWQSWLNESQRGEHKDYSPIILRGGRFVLPERVLEHGALQIAAGRIVRIFENLQDLPAIETIDLSGLTVFPGFIDLHIHGAAGIDTLTAGADDLLRVSEHLALQGTTSWVPTLVPAGAAAYEHAVRSIEDSIRIQEKETEKQSRILGVHYEGPFVNSEQCGALHREHFRTFKKEDETEFATRITNEKSGSCNDSRPRDRRRH